MSAPKQLYPYTSQDGSAIPIEIAQPLAMVRYSLVANTKKDIIIPEGWVVGWIYSDVDLVFSHNDTDLPYPLVDGTVYSEATFLPKRKPYSIKWVPGDGSILPLGTGTVYLMKIEQWAALVQSRQTTQG
jgi:hypothetical protein